MRVLMTTDTVGGVWTYTTQLISELLKREVSIALVTVGRLPSSEQHRWLTETEMCWQQTFFWETSRAPLEWMNNNEQAYVEAAPLLLRLAREFKPSLFHSNQYCYGALPLLLPKLIVAHSDVFSWGEACRGKNIEPSPWLETYSALVTAGLDGADALVAPTKWMLMALGANFRVPSAALVISNGRSLIPRPVAIERKLQAVTAGRLWDEAKNMELLAEVNSPFPILVAGETDREANTLLGRTAGLTVLGQLKEDELLAVFRGSAIYLCTSRYEPFGLAPLEAALCGCAVLAHDIASLREVWGEAALYFDDARSLSELLLLLAEHPDRLAAAQSRSYQHSQKYGAERMARAYMGLYAAMLAGKQVGAYVA